MTIKTLLAAAALTLSPALAMAACYEGHEKQAMSCADGTVYDTATNSCKVVSG